MNVKFYNRLSVKLIFVTSAILIANFAFHTLYTLTSLDKDLTKSLSENAYNTSDVIKKSTRYSMLYNRNYDVHQIINTIGTEPGVEKIRIYNKLGVTIFSTDSSELYSKVDVKAEACNVCHVNGKILSNLPEDNRIRVFKNASGKKVLGLINPIENEPDCYNDACHAHSSTTEILGVLDVVISMEKLDEIVKSNTQKIVVNSIIITLIVAVFSWLFISFLVKRPIKKIVKGIDELGKGNLDYKIDLSSQSELGEMALQFNEMSSRLNLAYKEIQEWSEKLNTKVQEKTEELKKIYDQIIQIEKLASLGKLSATVAHELNNPLEGILTYSKLIARKLSKQQTNNEFETILSYLSLISDESSRCGNIVKDLLLFSHRDENEFDSEELYCIIDRSVQLIAHHLEIHKIKLIKEYPDENIIIKCDGQKIQQAMISLLINSIEAMANGGTIKITIEKRTDKVHIRIIDEGIGISKEDLPHIFEPFYSTKTDGKGTGLGLSVVYGIIEQHKGRIEVEETSEKGTTFKIILPINISRVVNENTSNSNS